VDHPLNDALGALRRLNAARRNAVDLVTHVLADPPDRPIGRLDDELNGRTNATP
jgi:hypothetical protein